MKTYVVADIHGNYRLLDNFLKFSKYDKEKDRLICAGDFCDVGEHSIQVLATLEHERAIILVGNHEFAHCYKYSITPYNPELDSYAADYWMTRILNKDWGIAYEVENVLITHAGVSEALWKYKFFDTETYKVLAEVSPRKIMDYLNTTFWDSTSYNGKYLELLGNWWLNYDDQYSPLWYRPFDSNFYNDDVHINAPAPIKQVVGHTPAEYYPRETQQLLLEMNFIMIDPYSRHFHNSDYCKWAEIENGETSVHTTGVE